MEKNDFSLENSLTKIRGIIEKMQLSGLDFDENVSLFKEGMQAIKDSREYLDEAELMVNKLIETQDGVSDEPLMED